MNEKMQKEPLLLKRFFQRVEKTIDTLADEEKGR